MASRSYDRIDREVVRRMLEGLGYSPREKNNPQYPWVWIIEPAKGVSVGVAPHARRNVLQIDLGVEFGAESAEQLKGGVGPGGIAEIVGKIKLLMLNDHLDYRFERGDSGLKNIQVFEYLTTDEITPATLDRAIRRVKDAFFKVLVVLELADVAMQADEKGPKKLDELGQGKPTTSTVTAAEPEFSKDTIALLQQMRTPGQTLDEVARLLIEISKRLLKPGQSLENLRSDLGSSDAEGSPGPSR